MVGSPPTHASQSLRVSWSGAAPTACTNTIGGNWPGTDHRELHRRPGLTPPGAPQQNTKVASFTTVSPFDDFMYRADKEFSYTLFACANASCSRWYGNGMGNNESKSNTSADGHTQSEKWILRGVTGEIDVTSAAIDDPNANAPHAFFYPTGWATGYSEKLGLYYSKSGNTTSASEVYYKLHDSTGIPTARFNDTTSWLSAVLVSEGSTDTAEDDYAADHPWAMLTQEGSNKRVQLFVQSQHTTGHKVVVQIESVDELGDDFALGCESGTECDDTFLTGGGYIAVQADGTSGTSYVDKAQHGRVVWDTIAEPIINTSTAHPPEMMLQISRPYEGECHGEGDPPPDLVPDDFIGQARSTWNSGTGQWEWSVTTDTEVYEGDSYECPAVFIPEAHDNGSVSLDAGRVKMYYKSYIDSTWYVTYWDGAEWADDVPIQLRWDGSTSGPTHDCVENIVTVAYLSSTGVRTETMFFKLQDTTIFGTIGSVGFDDTTADDSAIVSAELAN